MMILGFEKFGRRIELTRFMYSNEFLKKNIEKKNLKRMDLNNLVPIMIMIEKLCPLHFSC